jgi:DNA-binding transcriptional LysR family regulator
MTTCPRRIAALAAPSATAAEIRIGCPDELRCWLLVPALADYQKRHPDIHFVLRRGSSAQLMEQLGNGELELSAAITRDQPTDAIQSWRQPLCWIGHPDTVIDEAAPLAIVTPPDGAIKDAMLDELTRQKTAFTVTFQAAHMDGAIAAVREGMGVTAVIGTEVAAGLLRLPDHPRLGALPWIYWGVYGNAVPNDPRMQQVTRQLAGLLQLTIQSMDRAQSAA